MKEHPIIFGAESVRAILAGTKTQTRRLPRFQPAAGVRQSALSPTGLEDGHGRILRPPCYRGEGLWVRETWQKSDPFEDTHIPAARLGGYGPKGICNGRPIEWRAVYRADGEIGEHPEHPEWGGWRWESPIYMPRWASRITLEVLSVRVQRLQDISEEDAKAEGCRSADPATGRECILTPSLGSYRLHFQSLWDAINGKRASWASNPWIWAIEFKRLAEHTTHKET